MVLSKTSLGSFRVNWMEWLTLLMFALLGLYALSDPIGRSAVSSYQNAAQQFIDTRQSPINGLVSRDDTDLKDLSAIGARTDNEVSFGVLPDKLSDQEQLDVPIMDVSQAIAAPVIQTEPVQDVIEQSAVVEAAGEPTTELDGIMNDNNTSFIPEDRNGTSLILNNDCNRSDVLTGLCTNDTDDALDFLND